MTSVTLLVPVVFESGRAEVVSMSGRVVWVSSAMVKISIRVEPASVRTVESEKKVHYDKSLLYCIHSTSNASGIASKVIAINRFGARKFIYKRFIFLIYSVDGVFQFS